MHTVLCSRVLLDTNTSFPSRQVKKRKLGYVYLAGSTYWINEFLAVGHVMYEIQLLQVLHKVHVDRIVLQRAPCATHDLCRGPSTYRSWYKGINIMMLYHLWLVSLNIFNWYSLYFYRLLRGGGSICRHHLRVCTWIVLPIQCFKTLGLCRRWGNSKQ